MNQRIKERLQDKLRERVEKSISSEQPAEEVETPSTAHVLSSKDLASNYSRQNLTELNLKLRRIGKRTTAR